jgi:signal transduction histidine kinase
MAQASGLLVRRWPERRRVVLGAAAVLLTAVFVMARALDDPALGVGLLAVLPVTLVALELGLRGGLAAAALAVGVIVLNAVDGQPELSAGAIATRAFVFVAVGTTAGWFSDRMRAARERERALLDSGLALGGALGIERIPPVAARAAMRIPGSLGAVVALEGAHTAEAGGTEGPRAIVPIAVGGAVLGRIELFGRARIGGEERVALELLALQAGLAAENQRLAQRDREAAALGVELRRVRDDLLEQRSGLGHLLDAQEQDRRRMAEKLQEDLAQVLAAVLLGLRMLRRDAPDDRAIPLDDLHGQIVGVLGDLRNVAGALRPSSLNELGLRAALEALAERVLDEQGCRIDLDVAAIPRPLPDPLQTAIFRIVEQGVHDSRPGGRGHVSLATGDGRLDLYLAVPLANPDVTVAATRARVEALQGSLRLEPAAVDVTRMRIRLPLAVPYEARAPGAGATGSVARTTVRPGHDSISSRPPASETRSLMPTSPKPSVEASGSNPRPSSDTSTQRTS